jgi:hypothetical protein
MSGVARRARVGLSRVPVALAVAMSTMMAALVVVAEPAPAETPATVYSSIASCTVGFAPSVFSSVDTVTMSTTFAPTGTSYRVGADGLGPELASVLLDATSSPNSPSLTGSAIGSMIGLASGTHSVEFYAVDAAGAAVGEALCTATYTYDGPVSLPVLAGATELPRMQVGVSAPNPSTGVVTGTITSTPTPAGSSHPTGCTVEVGGVDPEGDPLVYGVEGSTGPDPATAWESPTRELGDGLWFTQGDLTSECGTIWGTPTRAGTYTLRQTLTACLGMCGIVVGPTSVSSTEAEAQTFAVRRTLTLVVEPAASPRYTG